MKSRNLEANFLKYSWWLGFRKIITCYVCILDINDLKSVWFYRSDNEEETSTISSEEIIENEEIDEEMESSSGDSASHKSSNRRIVDWTNLKLPETCTLLTTPQGARIIVIGTAHFSKESQNDVTQVMNAVHPDVVMLELCKSRTNILSMDEETILSESQNLTAQKMVSISFHRFRGKSLLQSRLVFKVF